MDVKVKKIHPNSVIPQYAKSGDAGLDLTSVSEKIVEEKGYAYIEYDTGLAFEIPEGYVGLVFPRSSISTTGLLLANAVGVIDSSYRGTIRCRFKWIKDSVKYNPGERVAQIIILPYPAINLVEAEELSETSRAEGGFGSTN